MIVWTNGACLMLSMLGTLIYARLYYCIVISFEKTHIIQQVALFLIHIILQLVILIWHTEMQLISYNNYYDFQTQSGSAILNGSKTRSIVTNTLSKIKCIPGIVSTISNLSFKHTRTLNFQCVDIWLWLFKREWNTDYHLI